MSQCRRLVGEQQCVNQALDKRTLCAVHARRPVQSYQPQPVRITGGSVLMGIGHVLWTLTKLTFIVAIAALTALLVITGMMTRNTN